MSGLEEKKVFFGNVNLATKNKIELSVKWPINLQSQTKTIRVVELTGWKPNGRRVVCKELLEKPTKRERSITFVVIKHQSIISNTVDIIRPTVEVQFHWELNLKINIPKEQFESINFKSIFV